MIDAAFTWLAAHPHAQMDIGVYGLCVVWIAFAVLAYVKWDTW